MSQAERALAILHEWVKSESLRKHCYAVADSMKYFAQLRGEDVDLWEAVGLLHDMDYEKHPNLERSSTEGHPFVGVAWLRENGWSEEVCRAILSHADYSGITPETPMEKTLRAVDELSGFVVAVALVRPSKSVNDVDLASVKKKMKDKAFARAVNREEIIHGAEQLGLPLDEVIANVIAALKTDASRLGLAANWSLRLGANRGCKSAGRRRRVLARWSHDPSWRPGRDHPSLRQPDCPGCRARHELHELQQLQL